MAIQRHLVQPSGWPSDTQVLHRHAWSAGHSVCSACRVVMVFMHLERTARHRRANSGRVYRVCYTCPVVSSAWVSSTTWSRSRLKSLLQA